MWLNLAVETGLLGLLAALWVAFDAVRAWRRTGSAGPGDALRSVIGAAWLALLVDQLADNTLFSISTSAALWLLLAMIVIPEATGGDATVPGRPRLREAVRQLEHSRGAADR